MKKTNSKQRAKIIAVDLFCGVGGLSHGFVLEGIKVSAGIDLDPACEYAYESNNNGKFVKANVADVSGEDLKEYYSDATIKVLAGCAPCQPFSTYAHRYDQHRDNKWSLLHQFSRLVEESKPDIVTMENVPSVMKHPIFEEFVSELKKNKYHVWYKVVDSSKYGVPQTRRRLVLLASKLNEIQLIEPTSIKTKTVRQAIGRLPAIASGDTSKRDKLHTAASLSPTNLKRIKVSTQGGTWRDWPKELVAKCHVEKTGKTYSSVYGRMSWDKPSPTMTTQCYGFGNGRFGHPEQDRGISLREAAILQSFPRSYRFLKKEEAVNMRVLGRLIGNAVPVELGRAIAKTIKLHVKENR